MIIFKHAIDYSIDWSRRRWLSGVAGLFCSAWILPVQSLKAQPQRDISTEETLRHFVDVLLPADEFSPAASVVDVHIQILQAAKQDSKLALLIADGCHWLTGFAGSLAELTSEQLEQLLQTMSESKQDSVPRKFFHLIRDRAVLYYYADPRAWAGSALTHPPQPIGYPELGSR